MSSNLIEPRADALPRTARRLRNTPFVVAESTDHYRAAIEADLMQVSIIDRDGKQVVLPDGTRVTEFINCSYLGLDVDERVIAATRSPEERWGVNFCCARSRFSIEPQRALEEQLSELYGGRAITFPSTSTAHMSVLPLIASGVLFHPDQHEPVCMIFDEYAHASMQFIKPILATEARVEQVRHNDVAALRGQVLEAHERGERAVYVADSIYSMGGTCPIEELLELAEELDFYLYLDDAHGTSVFGEQGEGYVLSRLEGGLPDRIFMAFCLSKGYGAYGGGILVSSPWRERMLRTYGQIYSFSSAQPFQALEMCSVIVDLHRDGTVARLQRTLAERVALFDDLMGLDLPFSPVRMIEIGPEHLAIDAARFLLEAGFFVSAVFFPVVPRGAGQLRLCLAANHTEEEVRGLVDAVRAMRAQLGIVSNGAVEVPAKGTSAAGG